jgi:hypothetical protein
MNRIVLAGALALISSPMLANAQLGSGIVFDPTQAAHAAQQILQASSLYTTTVQTAQNVIGAYNLAQRMANLPQALYTSYADLGRQQWTTLESSANVYGNTRPWISAAGTGYGANAASQGVSISRVGRIEGYASLNSDGQRVIAAQGATVDLSDSVSATNLQTVGTIRANSADPAQHTEMATLQRINQALLIELRTQQETNQMLQAQALQMMVGQKTQQDNLKSLFQTGSSYQQNFRSVTPTLSGAGLQWGLHY